MNNFTLVFQPIVSLKPEQGYSVTGHEILTRFPNQNTQEAILEMEASGAIPRFDLEILKHGVAIASSHDKDISVNVSNSSISTPGFLDEMEKILGDKSHKNLLVEITETQKPSTEHIQRLIEICHARDIKVGLDDYGSGYADMELVKAHKFDFVKIDGSLTKSYDTSIIARSKILQLAEHCQSNNIPVTIEFIENAKQMMTFDKLGLDKGQGYLFGSAQPKPMTDQQVRTNMVVQSRPQKDQEKSNQFNM